MLKAQKTRLYPSRAVTPREQGVPATTPRRAEASLIPGDWPAGPLGSAIGASASGLTRAAGWTLGLIEQTVRGEGCADAAGQTPAQTRWARALDVSDYPERELRIGLSMDASLARRITDADGAGGVRYQMLPVGVALKDAARSRALDAVVAVTPAGLILVTPEIPGRDAGWYDWATPRPVSYPGVFPTRLDCARLTLEHERLADPAAAALVRGLAEAAAALSRADARLTLADRCRGRKAIDGRGIADAAMHRLRSALERFVVDVSTRPATASARAAARVLSAWALQDGAELPPRERRRIAELAARVAGDEPEVMLRLGAARLADLDDQNAVAALLSADRMLRAAPAMPGVAAAGFVQAELAHGAHDPLTLARVAGGLVLDSTALRPGPMMHAHDDLLDEARFSAWFVGRDQDRAVLLAVSRELARQRRAETLGLPQACTSATAAGEGAKAVAMTAPQTRKTTARASTRKPAAKTAASPRRRGSKTNAAKPATGTKAKPASGQSAKNASAIGRTTSSKTAKRRAA